MECQTITNFDFEAVNFEYEFVPNKILPNTPILQHLISCSQRTSLILIPLISDKKSINNPGMTGQDQESWRTRRLAGEVRDGG